MFEIIGKIGREQNVGAIQPVAHNASEVLPRRNSAAKVIPSIRAFSGAMTEDVPRDERIAKWYSRAASA